ncbi:hypothetical protein FB45DRAFT_422934 [Roridomyces roridus]|uniref:F-box domain-containing protein n=1 Tax=Roridomyces roridus TaxID=1738132 RepID=A0AAD7FRX2_9AGAR|nr:hypothetical protein FB45DRAFT_422934 [Roridomyces roridus]
MLAEIFTHCVDPTTPLDQVESGEWAISRVCRKWRGVAIARPYLWSHFVFPVAGPEKALRRLERISKIKLERTNNTAPLFVRFRNQGSRGAGILGMLLACSAQWREITFDDERDVFRFLKHGLRAAFPQLRKLELDSSDPLLHGEDESTRFDMITSLPALTDVSMNLHYQSLPPQLHLPWSQLRCCVLRDFKMSDVLRIISLLPLAASVSAMDLEPGSRPATTIESRIGALELHGFILDSINFLDMLRAPSLKKLVLSRAYCYNKTGQLALFLGRSGCTLEHLRIESGSNFSILEILRLTGMKGVVRLDLDYITYLRNVLELLDRGDSSLVPNLRTLVWRKRPDFDEQEMVIMGLLSHRNPSVRRLPFARGSFLKRFLVDWMLLFWRNRRNTSVTCK